MQPGGFRRVHHRAAAFQIVARQPVLAFEAGEGLDACLLVLLVGQKAQAPRIGGGKRPAAQDEYSRLAVGRRTGGRYAVEVLVVGVAEGIGIRILGDLDPIENAAADEARAFERSAAVRDDEECMLARFQVGHQALPADLAEDAAANRRRVQVAEVHVDVRLPRTGQTEFAGTHREMLHAALVDQGFPIAQLSLRRQARCRHGYGLDDADLPGDGIGTAHDHLILGDDRHRGAADRIEANLPLIGLGLADFNLGPGKFADILLNEPRQFALGYADQQDRLAVLENAHTANHAFSVHADQGHHRLAGIRGYIDDVGGQEYIANHLARGPRLVICLDIARMPQPGRKTVSPRQHIPARRVGAQVGVGRQLRRQGCVVRTGPRRQREQQGEQKQADPNRTVAGKEVVQVHLGIHRKKTAEYGKVRSRSSSVPLK